MGYTICYYAGKHSSLHPDSMPGLSIRTVGRRKIAQIGVGSHPSARQRANHRPGNPNILNIIQTPQITNQAKSHTYKRLGGIPNETAKTIRTPLVAQALLPAFFAPAFPCAAYCAQPPTQNHQTEKRKRKPARPCSHRAVQSTLANFGRTQILPPSLAVTTLLARSAHLVRVRALLGARAMTGAGCTCSPRNKRTNA